MHVGVMWVRERVCACYSNADSSGGYFESDPLTAADRTQLLGTMTQDDGYGCRRGTSQTARGEKGG